MTSGMPYRAGKLVTLQLQNILMSRGPFGFLFQTFKLSSLRNDWQVLAEKLDEEFRIGGNYRVIVEIEIDANFKFICRSDTVHVIPPQRRVYLFELAMNNMFRVLQTFSFDYEKQESIWYFQNADITWKHDLKKAGPKFDIDQGFESLFMFTGHTLPRTTGEYAAGTLRDFTEYLEEIRVAWTKLLIHPKRELFLRFWRTFYNHYALRDQSIGNINLPEVLRELRLK